MEVPPRPKEQQIIPRRLMGWLVIVGLVMAAGTLGVLAWGERQLRRRGRTDDGHDHVRAVPSVLVARDRGRGVSRSSAGSILGNRPLLMATGLSVLTIILATELGFLQRLLGTVSLTRRPVGRLHRSSSLSLIVVEEVRKLLKIKTGDEPTGITAPASVAA